MSNALWQIKKLFRNDADADDKDKLGESLQIMMNWVVYQGFSGVGTRFCQSGLGNFFIWSYQWDRDREYYYFSLIVGTSD